MAERRKIDIRPIGCVRRAPDAENETDRSAVVEVVLNDDLTGAVDRLDEFSHIYVIFWLDKIAEDRRAVVHHPGNHEGPPIGILATRAPIRPNPSGLTLVELFKRSGNLLYVRGLDADDGTPVLDIKPFPDWASGAPTTPESFRTPEWLSRLLGSSEVTDGSLGGGDDA